MKKTFFHQACAHIRNIFKFHRDKGSIPDFIGDDIWKEIETLRKTDDKLVRQATVNKMNRGSKNARDAGSYRGGSCKVSKWRKRMVSVLYINVQFYL